MCDSIDNHINNFPNLSDSVTKIWATDNDIPEAKSKNVFKSGILNQKNGTIPFGVKEPPVKLLEFKLKWK